MHLGPEVNAGCPLSFWALLFGDRVSHWPETGQLGWRVAGILKCLPPQSWDERGILFCFSPHFRFPVGSKD